MSLIPTPHRLGSDAANEQPTHFSTTWARHTSECHQHECTSKRQTCITSTIHSQNSSHGASAQATQSHDRAKHLHTPTHSFPTQSCPSAVQGFIHGYVKTLVDQLTKISEKTLWVKNGRKYKGVKISTQNCGTRGTRETQTHTPRANDSKSVRRKKLVICPSRRAVREHFLHNIPSRPKSHRQPSV